ncbi:hypothetical protein N7481_004554 [Penicillium waksmanii]|uniref:uncharacterized protein n=1 Tax=Penicillium waksmanii TaxID=69791 RepID=UPI002548614A|nr:uncharacterized protein N7481_004554 [Penicillium waksmanii]KAJ5989344.1 hypothetical protein N7481_004554 [Penicillium waksmanii]
MSLLGKKFPGLLGKPMTPFFAAGAIVLYGVNSLQNVLSNTSGPTKPFTYHRKSTAAEFKNDPRNPNAKSGNAGH